MTNNTKIELYYFAPKLLVDSLIPVILFASLTALLVFDTAQPFGIIVAFFIWFLFGEAFVSAIRNLTRFFHRKPAIELTDKYFSDHISNFKIFWADIINVRMKSSGGNTFLVFELSDNANYIKQERYLITKLLSKLKPVSEGIAVQTELSLVKGSNNEVFEIINNILKVKATHNTR